MIEHHELEAIEIESNHAIEIDSFIARNEIDERFLDSPYYIAPNEPVGQEAFAVIREAMRGKNMVALGRVVLSKRERVIMLQPWESGLLGMTLRYSYELREGPCAGTAMDRAGTVQAGDENSGRRQLGAREIKFDGFRMHARIVGGAIALLTRNGLVWTAKYLDIAAAIG